MKKISFLLVLFSISTTVLANADTDKINKVYSDVAHQKCDSNLIDKAKNNAELKKDSSAINLACFITAKTAIESCHAKAIDIIKDYIVSEDQERSKTMTLSSYDLCANYADVVSNIVVTTIISDAKKNKTSINDEAKKKMLNTSNK